MRRKFVTVACVLIVLAYIFIAVFVLVAVIAFVARRPVLSLSVFLSAVLIMACDSYVEENKDTES